MRCFALCAIVATAGAIVHTNLDVSVLNSLSGKATLGAHKSLSGKSYGSATHYGDPCNGSCMSDEQTVSVTGIDGSFCSPPCQGTTCPTDIPAGVSANPMCALNSPQGAKYCALICSPTALIKDQKAADAACGDGASCKPIQGQGLCTYDDCGPSPAPTPPPVPTPPPAPTPPTPPPAPGAHPLLPTRWIAKTKEPGSPPQFAVGVEAYNFQSRPTEAQPSSMWSNYTGCQRLISVVTGGASPKNMRYLFGCDAVNCCHEPQPNNGNQVEYQIPQTNIATKATVSHSINDVTTAFETVTGADTWTWHWGPIPLPKYQQTFNVYTTNPGGDDSTLVLHRWNVNTPIATNFSLANIDFVNFTHVAPEDQAAFDASFTRPTTQECRLPCPSAVKQGLLKQETYDHLLGRPTLLL